MSKISYTQPDGSVSIVDANPGTSVMRAAQQAGVPGIVGTCGGQAMCASCHVYLLRSSADLEGPEEEEEDMLE
jgi:2Fe-2S ferredoxin